jgi:hypothetical protein
METVRRHKDGRLIDISLQFSPTCDAKGNCRRLEDRATSPSTSTLEWDSDSEKKSAAMPRPPLIGFGKSVRLQIHAPD